MIIDSEWGNTITLMHHIEINDDTSNNRPRERREGQTPLVDKVVWSPRPSTGGKRPRAGPEASQAPGEDSASQDIFTMDTPGQDIFNMDTAGQDIFTMDTPKLPAQRKSRRVDK